MASSALRYLEKPRTKNPRMLMGFSGWMDGGDVSTGTIGCMIEKLVPSRMAEIRPTGFYIYNFPGSMEFTSLFRPHTEIEEGLIKDYTLPDNAFYYCAEANLILFEGKEPNVDWERFAECIFTVAEDCNVGTIYYVGSYAGVVPHSRDARLYATSSSKPLRDEMIAKDFRPTSYEGPAGFISHLLHEASNRDIRLSSIVAEIPAYVQGRNPKCIERVLREISKVFHLELDLSDLTDKSEAFCKEVEKAVLGKEDLTEMVRKLEIDYDKDYMETHMGDLKDWLKGQGFEVP
jgi:predicted ATP-grasp superfamily ATP-dependent carboligase